MANTLSFSEKSKGWVSFKSWDHENGISLNNSYYTFSNGRMYQHHINETRNEFYGTQFESSVDVLFNQIPGSIKSFSTLNYEGSQARITPDINNNPDYYDNFPKDGWYVDEMISNAQEVGVLEFWDKEDKWFSQIKGIKTEWLNDGTAGNIDPREFSYQGIGNSDTALCPECPSVITWNCISGTHGECECQQVNGGYGEFATEQACLCSTGCCGQTPITWGCTDDGMCTDPGDGSGQYSTYCECVMQSMCCNEGVAYSYGCSSKTPPTSYVFGCMDDGITTDPFIIQQRPSTWIGPATNYTTGANVNSCNCLYSTAQTWECIEGNCDEIFDGTGTYVSLADCNQKCGDPGNNPCDPPENIGVQFNITDPTVIENPCLYFASDGSVSIMVTNINSTSTTPFTTWTLELYDSTTIGSPSPNNLIYTDPNVYPVGTWSNVYIGLTAVNAGTTGYGIYYAVITDNNGCIYGPFVIRVNCIPEPDPCENYPGDNGCCGKCPDPMPSSNPCYSFCQQWGDCCDPEDPPSGWDCVTMGGTFTCVDHNGPYGLSLGDWFYVAGGQYLTLNQCLDVCAIGPSWECIEGNCFDVGVGNGTYTSLSNCNINCIGDDPGNLSCDDLLYGFEACSDWAILQAGNSQYTTAELVQHWYDIFIGGGYINIATGTSLIPLTLASLQALLEDCCSGGGPGPCDDGMDVAFIFDYTQSMDPYIIDIKNGIASIVNQIDTLSGTNDYRLSLTLVDESKVGGMAPFYVSDFYTQLPHPEYANLSTTQKYVGPGTLLGADCTNNETGSYSVVQYITNMEGFGLNNAATFTMQLGTLYDPSNSNSMPLGNGIGLAEPTDVAIEMIGTQAFSGTWRNDVAKYIILFTDNLPAGMDDCCTNVDIIKLANLAVDLVAENIKVIVIGGGVDLMYLGNYPWRVFADATGGIWDAASNGNYSQAVIDNLATLCDDTGSVSAWECVNGTCVWGMNYGFTSYPSQAACMQSPGCGGN